MIVMILFGRANPICENNENPMRINQWDTGFPRKSQDPITRKHLSLKKALKQMKSCITLYDEIRI